MSQSDSREEHRALKRQADIRKLWSLENAAVNQGQKLGPRDRLRAAFHLTRAWGEAKAAGLRKEDFQDAILGRLKRRHGSRQEFRLSNWTLRLGEDPNMQPELAKEYENKTTPQRALEPYFVGIAVAAEHCATDADDWKLAMASTLSIWSRTYERADVAPLDDRSAETLAVLLNALCTRLARKNRLGAIFAAVREMNCHWDMYEERLATSEHVLMQPIKSPIFPVYEDCLYYEEMFPYPSVPLIRVPYVTGGAVFNLAPLNRHDDGSGPRTCINDIELEHDSVPGEVFWFREIRLCIVPDGHGGFVSALETRPHMEVRLNGVSAFADRYHVLRGGLIDIADGSFYGTDRVCPTIQTQDGQTWSIDMNVLPEHMRRVTTRKATDLDVMASESLYFDPDPVHAPGVVGYEPWYLSYTPASPPYLRHWLALEWRLANEGAACPWDRDNFIWGKPGARWDRNLPPIHELNFPDFSNATWVECCLHNGLIEDAMQACIERLTEQTARLQADWQAARERHTNALLRRWNTETAKEDRP